MKVHKWVNSWMNLPYHIWSYWVEKIKTKQKKLLLEAKVLTFFSPISLLGDRWWIQLIILHWTIKSIMKMKENKKIPRQIRNSPHVKTELQVFRTWSTLFTQPELYKSCRKYKLNNKKETRQKLLLPKSSNRGSGLLHLHQQQQESQCVHPTQPAFSINQLQMRKTWL